MTKNRNVLLFAALISFNSAGAFPPASQASKDWLQECVNIQVKPLAGKMMKFSYLEKQHNTYHSPEPWQTLASTSTGLIWLKPKSFMQLDTVKGKDRVFVSKLVFTENGLFSQPYWSEKPSNVSKSEFERQPIELARYSPALLLTYFADHGAKPDNRSDKDYAVYKLQLNETFAELWIRKKDNILEKTIIRENNDLWGDVTTTVSYSGQATYKDLHYAKDIIIEKIHGNRDTVSMSALGFEEAAPLLEKPEGYKIEEDAPTKATVAVEQTGKHIFSIHLPQADTRTSLLEFKDFFVVIDVPLNSENGALVLNEVKKINPDKPVKYYVFGHHHPWYIGGVRPFILNGTTVLCTKDDIDYVNFIATAQHTIKPDGLQLHPVAVKTEVIEENKTISDGEFELQIYHIGKKSLHTNDYMLFYIPSEKLLIEDDLTWIDQKGPVKKAGVREAALYKAVKELGLDVSTVVQHWPDGERYGVKSQFSFSELEESANMKQ